MGEKPTTATPGETSEKTQHATADVGGVKGAVLEASGDHNKGIILMEDPAPPTKVEIAGWHAYALCSYFVQTVLIPILFPLIIAQAVAPPSSSPVEDGWTYNSRGTACRRKEVLLYQSLVTHSIPADGSRFSPLHWTAISWVVGTILAMPALVPSAWFLDHGQSPPAALGAVAMAGALFCLLTGFFKSRWVFSLYIIAIAAADTIATAAHTRQLGAIVRGLTARFPGTRRHFWGRRAVTGWLSLHATAVGCFGAAVIASFTYHMLRRSDHRTSLWVVSIFSGLLWAAGVTNTVTASPPGPTSRSRRPDHGKLVHFWAIFRYPHAAGSLAGIFLSSFSSMCIFIGGLLYVFGQLCMKPVALLYLWLIYFIFPVVSLPALHPLQLSLRADAVRMQLLGYLMSAVTAGAGFYYRGRNWHQAHVLLAAFLQSTATGTLHAFGRVLASDCSPAGREGAFSVWATWVRTAGSCAGFAVASAYPGDVGKMFGMAFCAVAVGACVLVFGKISHGAGVEAAGHVREGGDHCQGGGILDEMKQGGKSSCEPLHLDEEKEGKDGIQVV